MRFAIGIPVSRVLLPVLAATTLLLVGLALSSTAVLAEELRNDGWEPGQSAGFQAGFVAGEIGAVRLTPNTACPCDVTRVRLLFGGSVGSQSITLRIWDDSAGTTNPGAELFSNVYLLSDSDTSLTEIDLSGQGISVNGPFRVGIEFSAAGTPSIARDDDGNINATENFIFTGGTWFQSSLLGVTGDWIIRADEGPPEYSVSGTVAGLDGSLTLQNNGGDDLVLNADGPFTFDTPVEDGSGYNITILSEPPGQICTVASGSGVIAGADVNDVTVECVYTGELRNEDWVPGQSAGFQSGFLAGEFAAVRLLPNEPCPCRINNVRLLFGGTNGSQTITLYVWDDSGGNLVPGTRLFSGDYLLQDADDSLTVIDLEEENIVVNGTIRVGVQFSDAGLPSIARDASGGPFVPGRNFIFTPGFGWQESSSFGLTNDWVLRAGIPGLVGGSVWEDQNGDGIHGAGEPPLTFLPVYLLDEGGGITHATFTDLTGDYSFTPPNNLPARVKFPVADGYFLTLPNQGSDDTLDSDANQVTEETTLIPAPFAPEDAVNWCAGMIQLGPCFPPDEAVYLYMVRLSADGNDYPILDFVDFNQPEQVTGYHIYRSSDPGLDPALWPRVADDIVDGFESVPDLQWVDLSGDVSPSGIWYYQVTPFNNGCGAEGPR